MVNIKKTKKILYVGFLLILLSFGISRVKAQTSNLSSYQNYSIDNFNIYNGTDPSSQSAIIVSFDLGIQATSSDLIFYKNNLKVSNDSSGVLGNSSIEAVSPNMIDNGTYYTIPAGSTGTTSIVSYFAPNAIDKGPATLDISINPQTSLNLKLTANYINYCEFALFKWSPIPNALNYKVSASYSIKVGKSSQTFNFYQGIESKSTQQVVDIAEMVNALNYKNHTEYIDQNIQSLTFNVQAIGSNNSQLANSSISLPYATSAVLPTSPCRPQATSVRTSY